MAEEHSFIILGSSSMPSKTDDNDKKSKTDTPDSFSSSRRCQVAQETELAKNTEPKTSCIQIEVDADVLKTSVYSQFPSICSMEAGAEDVLKLQAFLQDYLVLKQTIKSNNDTMSQYYNQTLQWKENSRRVESRYKQQLEEREKQIAALRNQNLELKREVDKQMEQIKVMNEQQQLIRSRFQIPECAKTIAFHISQASSEFVPLSEHTRAIKALEDKTRRITVLETENKELSDSKTTSMVEINSLKVNLVSAEELIKQSRAEINLLKAKDIEKSKTLDRNEAERLKMREELTLLCPQVEAETIPKRGMRCPICREKFSSPVILQKHARSHFL